MLIRLLHGMFAHALILFARWSQAATQGTEMDLFSSLSAASSFDPNETFLNHCDQVSDWHELFTCAREQGVDGIVLQAMLRNEVPVPPEILQRFGGHMASQHLVHRQLVDTEARLSRDFSAAGIRAVAIHGPNLAERIGALEVGMGSSGTLSFLVARRDYLTAVRLLQDYDGALITVRCSLDNGVTELDVEKMVRRSVRYENPAGDRLWVLSPVDELILLATDVAARDFGNLGWLYDLRLFLESYCELEPAYVMARALELGIEETFAGIIELLEVCLGVSLDHLASNETWPVVSGAPLCQQEAWELADDVLAGAVSSSWGLRLRDKKPS